MSAWPQIKCPDCDHEADPPDAVDVDCGKVSGECICPDCDHHFPSPKIEYWMWLGLESAPAD